MSLFSIKLTTTVALTLTSFASSLSAQLPTPKPPDTVFLEQLTWDELALLIQNGKTTAIVGTAGTEQKGPHMAIGEHKYATEYCAEQIARALGNAIVAPVVTYVPEGSWERPTGHMSKAGSITLPEERFRTLLEALPRLNEYPSSRRSAQSRYTHQPNVGQRDIVGITCRRTKAVWCQ